MAFSTGKLRAEMVEWHKAGLIESECNLWDLTEDATVQILQVVREHLTNGNTEA